MAKKHLFSFINSDFFAFNSTYFIYCMFNNVFGRRAFAFKLDSNSYFNDYSKYIPFHWTTYDG